MFSRIWEDVLRKALNCKTLRVIILFKSFAYFFVGIEKELYLCSPVRNNENYFLLGEYVLKNLDRLYHTFRSVTYIKFFERLKLKTAFT